MDHRLTVVPTVLVGLVAAGASVVGGKPRETTSKPVTEASRPSVAAVRDRAERNRSQIRQRVMPVSTSVDRVAHPGNGGAG